MSGLGAFMSGAASGAMQAKQIETMGQGIGMKKKMATEQPGTAQQLPTEATKQVGMPTKAPETSDWQFVRSLFGSSN